LTDLAEQGHLTGYQMILVGLAVVLIFLLIASSSQHYWDEYFYLYSVSAHEPGALLDMEHGLGGLFPPGFYAGKLGFIYFLDSLVDLAGTGPESLFIIQSIFSLLTILLALASYGLLIQLLPQSDAISVSIVLLFTPLMLYFNSKVLTEIPSLLLVIIATMSFLKSFSASSRLRMLWLVLATVVLFAAIWMRFIVVVFYVGMILGLFVLHDDRYPFWKVFVGAAITGTGAVILLVLAWFNMLEDPAGSISGLIGNLTNRSQGLIIRLYALAVFIQLFGIYMLAALWKPWTGVHRLAIVWVLFASVPFLIGSSYAEPRFFYMALIPFAILVWLGMATFAKAWPGFFAGYRGWLVFVLLVVLNRWIFVPLMPSEHDQDAYQAIMNREIGEGKSAQYLVPWISDYCLLRFMYPDQAIYLVMDWAYDGDEEFFTSQPFRRWVGPGRYLANINELDLHPLPWRYVGWDYSPVIKRMQSIARKIGFPAGGIKEGQKNHLSLGWPWHDEHLTRTRLHSDGHYEIYALITAASRQD